MSTTPISPLPSPSQPAATLPGAVERRVATVALCIVFGAGIIGFRSWLDARDDRMRMSATLASQQSIIAAAGKREQDRDQQLAATLKQIADLKRSVQTPQQVLRELPQYLPPLPQPLEMLAPSRAPGAQGSPSGSAGGPAPAASRESKAGTAAGPGEVLHSAARGSAAVPDVRVPSADLKPLFDFVQDCRACEAQLTAAQQDLADERTKSAALSKERDAAVKAAKGGTAWTRTLRAVKWAGIGFVVGYVARSATR